LSSVVNIVTRQDPVWILVTEFASLGKRSSQLEIVSEVDITIYQEQLYKFQNFGVDEREVAHGQGRMLSPLSQLVHIEYFILKITVTFLM
jgi:hypothetical protein